MFYYLAGWRDHCFARRSGRAAVQPVHPGRSCVLQLVKNAYARARPAGQLRIFYVFRGSAVSVIHVAKSADCVRRQGRAYEYGQLMQIKKLKGKYNARN